MDSSEHYWLPWLQTYQKLQAATRTGTAGVPAELKQVQQWLQDGAARFKPPSEQSAATLKKGGTLKASAYGPGKGFAIDKQLVEATLELSQLLVGVTHTNKRAACLSAVACVPSCLFTQHLQRSRSQHTVPTRICIISHKPKHTLSCLECLAGTGRVANTPAAQTCHKGEGSQAQHTLSTGHTSSSRCSRLTSSSSCCVCRRSSTGCAECGGRAGSGGCVWTGAGVPGKVSAPDPQDRT